QRLSNGLVQLGTQPPIIGLDFLALGPIGRFIGRQTAANRINSKGKQFVKSRMKGLQPKRALRQQIPIERFYVAEIENDAMALGNRTIIQRFVANDVEQLIGTGASIDQAGVQLMPNANRTTEGSHELAL